MGERRERDTPHPTPLNRVIFKPRTSAGPAWGDGGSLGFVALAAPAEPSAWGCERALISSELLCN